VVRRLKVTIEPGDGVLPAAAPWLGFPRAVPGVVPLGDHHGEIDNVFVPASAMPAWLQAFADNGSLGVPPGTRTPNPLIKRWRNYLLFRVR
jgi:hypothetical protein